MCFHLALTLEQAAGAAFTNSCICDEFTWHGHWRLNYWWGEIISRHQHLSELIKGTGRHYVLEQPADLWWCHWLKKHSSANFKLAVFCFGQASQNVFLLKPPCICGTPWMFKKRSSIRNGSVISSNLLKSYYSSADELRSWAKAMWTEDMSGEDYVNLLYDLLIYKATFHYKFSWIFHTNTMKWSAFPHSHSLSKHLAWINSEQSLNSL